MVTRWGPVASLLLLVALSNALPPQPTVLHSPSEADASDEDLSVERIQSRLVSLESRLSRREMIVSTVNNPLIKDHCTVDLASFGYDDQTMLGFVRTSGGSSEEVLLQKDLLLVPKDVSRYRGITLFELDATTCTTRNRQTFDILASAGNKVQLMEALESATTGTILVAVTADATQRDPKSLDFPGQFFTRYNMDLSGLMWRDKFAFILQKGYPKKTFIQRKLAGGDSLRMKIALQGTTVSDVTFKRV